MILFVEYNQSVKDLDLDVEATINLAVWIDGLDLSDSDWGHLQSEVR